jgi:hypothetical protein
MVVVVVFPVADDHPGLRQGPEAVDVETFVADAGVEGFDVAVARRLTGRDKVQTDLPEAQSAIAPQANSGPLSHLSTVGNVPRSTARRSSAPIRWSPVMLRSTIPPRHSRVCSSMIDTILIGRPSVVTSNWKSTAHT